MKKNILIIALYSIFSFNAFAQKEISPLDYERPALAKPVVKTNMNQEKIEKLEEALRTQNYSSFFEVLASTIQNDEYINYLNSKAPEGHAPVYWLMADYYSIHKNAKEAHKWYYIAIIITQQDSATCLDLTARFATQKIMKLFPATLTITRGTPQFINPAMTEVVFFIESLKQRPHPQWACVYGDNNYMYPKEKNINSNLWKEKREEIFNKFTVNFAK